MKQEDYDKYSEDLLNAVMEFNGLFADYVKQMDVGLWGRAVDYAKEYAKSNTVSFNYSNEKTSKQVLNNTVSQTIFIKELSDEIEITRETYLTFFETNKELSVVEIQNKWLEENKTTEKDPFGYEEDITLFIDCEHKFTFSVFDEDDWLAYTNIVVCCVIDPDFQQEFKSILLERFTEKSDLYKHYIICMEEQNGEE